ncbi:MAG: penicillin acylase family protein, partial [bacterium]
SGEKLAAIGDGGYGHGIRARQIRDDLLAHDRADEKDMLAVQLDDRALFLQWWRDLLLDILTPAATSTHPERAEFRRLADETWTGHASVESAGYRLVRAFRYNLREEVYGWLTADCLAVDPEFDSRQLPYWEGVLRSLLRERPRHLLPSRFGTWDDALLAVVDSTVVEFTAGEQILADRTWGERNTTALRHPLSAAVPLLSRWVDMPPRQLPGDSYMPRVQHPRSGASERMVVAPGREEQGIFHMPCGQSGHPFSPYFGAGHDAWEQGRPTPLLAGPTVWLLTLQPAAASDD